MITRNDIPFLTYDEIRSFSDGRISLSRENPVQLDRLVRGKVRRKARERYFKFFGEKIDSELVENIWYAENAQGFDGFMDYSEDLIVVKPSDFQVEVDILVHEFAHFKYQQDLPPGF